MVALFKASAFDFKKFDKTFSINFRAIAMLNEPRVAVVTVFCSEMKIALDKKFSQPKILLKNLTLKRIW